jgi:hypothetical protein
MRAGSANREHLLTASRQQHRVIADMAQQHGVLGELSEADTLSEIRPACFRLSFAHDPILLKV